MKSYSCEKKCESCGSILEPLRSGSSQGLICKKCGWSIVTTNISPIYLDERIYKITCRGDYRDKSHVMAVAKITSSNLLSSREMLKKGDFLIFSGQAPDIIRVIDILKRASIEYSIDPYFEWDETVKG
ncbi:hypothetical protein [Pseudomonas sp. GCEP-101]|uniref:hypothetical protein n=1 Tax=Pseudomonas sp. GCEP-101 TaxID=2974552 RepID=UPI00223AB951|nr:hypothetical protein [Pseudomonas sp. GCEP-101]